MIPITTVRGPWALVGLLMYEQSIEIGAVAIAVLTASSNSPDYAALICRLVLFEGLDGV